LARGISILASDKNVIGGEQPAARNVISLNDVGVDLGAKSSQNKVLGNLIGTNPQGTIALGNSIGIQVAGSRDQIGSATGGRNVISGNATFGVDLSGASNQVMGNFIGTDRLGTTAVANRQSGIRVAGEHAKNNIIGGIVGTRNGEGNVISGNIGNGLLITGQTVTGTRVFGNSIGTTADGSGALPNGSNGILTESGASEVEIGGPVPGDSNLISGNSGNGILLAGGASKVTIQENTIGLNAAGMKLGNSSSGIAIDGALTHTVSVGRLNFGNVISGNNRNGVIVNAAKQVTITADQIGATPGGSTVGNGGNGIDLTGAAHTFIGLKADDGNTIAGNNVGIRVANSTQTDVNLNVVSGNNGAGLQMVDSAQTQVDRNVIGLTADQSAPWGNKAAGISLDGSRHTTITDNVIAANGAAGVLLGHNSNTTTLTGNFIGTPSLSGLEQQRGNLGFGVAVQSAFDNTIGKTDDGNAIVFNTGGSVQVEFPRANGNSIRGNAMSGGGSAIVLLDHANDNLSAPVLTKLETLVGAVRITGTLDEQHQPGKEFHIDFYGVRQDGIVVYIASLQRKTDQDGLAIYRADLHVPNGVTSILATATLAAPGSTTMLSNGLAIPGAG
jgi:trimeric autotransporter adhesin